MRRMTKFQKIAAVLFELQKTGFPVSTHDLGKRLGFQSGKPLYGSLCWLNERGLVHVTDDTLNTGTPVYYWSITTAGLDWIRQYHEEGVISLVDRS